MVLQKYMHLLTYETKIKNNKYVYFILFHVFLTVPKLLNI
jgi:hypothetical protein